MDQTPSALRSALAVSVTRVVSMLLHVVLGMLSATYFGTSADKDCYLVAQTVPGLLTVFLIGGVYASLLVALNEIGEREGLGGQIAFTRAILWHLTLLLLPLVLLACVFPEPIIRLVAPGFDETTLRLSGRLLRLTAAGAVLAIYLAVTRCLYETRLQFIVPSVLNLLVPLGSLAVLISLVDTAGIFALALGPLLGTAVTVGLLQLLVRRVLRDRPTFTPVAESPVERVARRHRFWMSVVPMSIGANFGQINLLVDNAFASYLPGGSIALLGFAFVIISNLRLLTVSSLGEVTLPRMAGASLRGAAELQGMIRWAMRHMFLLTAPFCAGALSFGLPSVRLLFQRGAFTSNDTVGVAQLLACYGLELVLAGFVAVLTMVLLVRKRFALLTWTAAGAIVANAVLDYVLMKPLGVNGIALATPCSSLLHLLVLVPLVRREVSDVVSADDARFGFKVFFCAATMALLTGAWAWASEHYVDTSSEVGRTLEVGIGLTLGALSYAGLLHLARVKEARALFTRFIGGIPQLTRW
jgi:putative peptidoglycan lipid II flippase